MVDVRAQTDRREGVTLVTATVTADGGPTSVRLEPAVDGPVWPPRRQGEPAAGWTDDTFEGTIPDGGRLAVGFATPATPDEPPLRVLDTRPAETEDGDFDTPSAVLRGLGDPSPPSLAVPADGATDDECHSSTDGNGTNEIPTGDGPTEPGAATAETAVEATVADDGEETAADPELPPAVAEWLSTVAARIDRSEALAPDADVDAAADAIEACGGLGGALALEDSLASDAERLRTIEDRAGALADRAEATDLATAALERLR